MVWNWSKPSWISRKIRWSQHRSHMVSQETGTIRTYTNVMVISTLIVDSSQKSQSDGALLRWLDILGTQFTKKRIQLYVLFPAIIIIFPRQQLILSWSFSLNRAVCLCLLFPLFPVWCLHYEDFWGGREGGVKRWRGIGRGSVWLLIVFVRCGDYF